MRRILDLRWRGLRREDLDQGRIYSFPVDTPIGQDRPFRRPDTRILRGKPRNLRFCSSNAKVCGGGGNSASLENIPLSDFAIHRQVLSLRRGLRRQGYIALQYAGGSQLSSSRETRAGNAIFCCGRRHKRIELLIWGKRASLATPARNVRSEVFLAGEL